MTGDSWLVSVETSRGLVDALDQEFDIAFADNPPSIAAFALDHDPETYRVDAYFASPPNEASLNRMLTSVGLAGAVDIVHLPAQDWVSAAQSFLPPQRAGRFLVHGAHSLEEVDLADIALLIEAGQAFGTGHHETTKGCLLAIDWLNRRWPSRTPLSILDVGTGSSVLALAAAKVWRRAKVVASDIDPIAIAVARETLVKNQMIPVSGPRVRGVHCVIANGLHALAIQKSAPFELVIAKILAGPLRRMSRDMGRACAPGGIFLLSGLLISQEAGVLAAYRKEGAHLVKRWRIGDWSALLLKKGIG
ncbi:MAG: 50S ribosomal protein L11 methyltransferase [Pseudomonadota bacterium]